MNFSSFFSLESFEDSFTQHAIQFQPETQLDDDGKIFLQPGAECVNFTYKSTVQKNQPQTLKNQPSISEQIEVQVQSDEGAIKFANQRLTKMPRTHQQTWLPTEDDLLVELYQQYGNKQWRLISDELNQAYGNQRTPTQCNQHYNRVIRAGLLKGRWTEDQDQRLREAIERCGPTKWREIARYVGNRTDTQVRYRAMKQFPDLYL